MGFFEQIIRDFGAEMVDMVKADISTEPLHNFWQFEERSAFDRSLEIIPFWFAAPVSVLELVLNVKQVHAKGKSEKIGWERDQKEVFVTDQQMTPNNNDCQGEVRQVNAPPFLFLGLFRIQRETVRNEKDRDRPNQK